MSDTEKMQTEKDTEKKDMENPSNSNSKPPTKHKKSTKKKSRKRKITAIKDNSKPNDEPSKKKRKKKRGWSEREETLFKEGLELYGRDWNKVSKHVGNNRNNAAIRSHCQIYLLRLLQNGKKLPTKMLETGNGYTLSGKPLNKYSVVAVRHFNGAENVPMVDGVISDSENVARRSKNSKTKNGHSKSKSKKCKKNIKFYDSTDSSDEFEAYKTTIINNSNNKTEVRRSGRNRKQILVFDPPHISNPFGLRTDIEIYDNMVEINGNSNSKNNKRKSGFGNSKIYEPFKIFYCPNALLIADIHSHLLRSVEIMGLLGGTYDYNTRSLFIKKCYPLNEEQLTEVSVSAHSTEILNVSEKIKNIDGLKLIGWYHSHPCFDNVPSNLDCHQHSQNKSDNEKKQPYVGLIVQSLWNRNDKCSHWRWFNTKLLNKDNRNDYQYIALEFNGGKKVFNGINDNGLFQQINELVKRYNNCKYDIYRTDFGENNIGQKILNNIRYHLERHMDHNEDNDNDNDEEKDEENNNNNEIEIMVDKIEELFLKKRDVWWVTNKPKIDDDNNDEEKNNNDNKER